MLQTGRQALALLAQELGGTGRSSIAIPAFACESMIEPFQQRNWRVVPYPVDGRLRPRLEDAADLVGLGRADVVLAVRYFGAVPDRRDQAAVRAIRQAGAYVIADETHHPFSPLVLDADAAFASLRKTLPVASGAYLTRHVQASPPPAGEADGRWSAMDAFGGELGPSPDIRRAMDDANEVLESSDRPRSIDSRSRRTLERLNLDLISARRRANATALVEALSGFTRVVPAVSFGAHETPSHLPLRVAAPRTLQRRLAARRIYCPIHWSRPEGFAHGLAWPDDLLSVPVDHRYSPSSMRRVADVIREESAA